MGNIVLYFGSSKSIKRICNKYQEMYQADVLEIKTVNKVTFLDKLKSTYQNLYIPVKQSRINLNNYQNVILVSELWFSKLPSPVLRFLERETGRIKNIIYVLYNKNKEDKIKEFDKMDKVLNLRREKGYFITLIGKEIRVRVYQ